MAKKALVLLALVLVLMTTLIPGCTAPAPELVALEIVPQGVSLLADIQVGRIINDPDFRYAYNRMEKEADQPQTYDDALDQITAETGVDLRDVSRILLFMDITTLGELDYIGLIAEGTFNETELISRIQAETGERFVTSDYQGYKLYQDELGESVITFLSDSMLLAGTMKAVKDAIDVSKNVRQPVGGNILDTFNRLGSSLIKAVVEVPEETRNDLIEESVLGEFPLSMESFADIDILGFAFYKEAGAITIQIKPHFLSTDSAHDAEDTIRGALSLFRGTMQVPEVKDLLGKIEVSLSDSSLTISFTATLSEIEQLMETLLSDFTGEFE